MFNKLKMLQVNFALIAFACFTIKVLITQASLSDSLIIVVMGSLYGYTQYLKRFQPYKLDDAIVKDLMEVKSALTKLNMVRATDKLAEKRYF